MEYPRMNLLISIVLTTVLGITSGIHLTHDSIIRHPDSTFLVTCKDPAGRAVVWSGPKGPLGATSHPKVETASYGTSLIFNKVAIKDSGNYTCSAGNEFKIFHLKVEDPLTFMDTSPIQTGREDTNITLRCEVKGGVGGKPIVTWSVENGVIKKPKFDEIGDGLVIMNLTRADSKTYICKATQPSTGDIKEQKIQLKVEHKPVLKRPHWAQDEEAFGYIGGIVNLTCEVIAEPPATFTWYYKKIKAHDGRIHNDTHKSVLELHIKDPTIFGNYKCVATNKIGTLEKIFTLQQGIRPSPPDFVELRGENSDLLDIGIHPPKEKLTLTMMPTGYRVEYKPKKEKHWKQADFDISPDNSYPLRQLKHNTEYEVRAATRNKAGHSVFTETSTFRTLTSQSDGATTSRRIAHNLLLTTLFLLTAGHW